MAAIAIIFVFSLPAFAEVIGVVTGSGVNIRQGAGTNFDVIGIAAKNTAYQVVNEEDGWYQIRYSGGDPAWISATYLATSTNNDLPQQVTTKEMLNIRSGPGLDYTVLATAAANTDFQVLGESGYWYQIDYGDADAYIAKWLVNIVNDSTVTDGSGSGSGQTASGQTGSGTGASTTAYVDTSVLNLRASGSTSAEIISKLYQDDQITVYQSVDGWYQIKTADGLNGWVDGQYVAFAQGETSVSVMQPAQAPAFAGTVSQGNVTLTYTKTDYGYRLTLTGDTMISYTVSGDNQDMCISTDMTIKGDLPQDDTFQFSINGSLQNQLNVVCSSIMYYGLTISADERVLTIELGLSPLVGKLIYLDPGHGAISAYGEPDPGATSASGLLEKDVTLDIALKAQALLEARGATVVLSRGETTDLTLGDRAYPANMIGADVLVSIHCNSSTNQAVSGTSVWYYAPSGDAAYDRQKVLLLAQSLQTALLQSAGRKDYGMYESNFAVLRASTMPAALVETAFLSNATEAQLLATDSFRQQLAEGIVNGLSLYFSAL